MTYWPHSAPEDVGMDGQRPCARGERCRSATVVRGDDGAMRREPALGPRAYCDTDKAEVVHALERLPERYLELALRLGDRSSGDGPKVSGGTPGSSPPIRDDIDALMVQVVNIVASWDERVRDVARLANRPGPPIPEHRGSGTAGVALSRMCQTLAVQIDVLLGLAPAVMRRYVSLREASELVAAGEVAGIVRPYAGYAEVDRDRDGAAAGEEILRLDRHCRHMLGWTPQHQHLNDVPCWECGLRSLRRWDGGAGLEDRAECSNPSCQAVYEDGLTSQAFTLLMQQVEQASRAKQTRAAS